MISSVIPGNLVLLTKSEQFGPKSAHILPTNNSFQEKNNIKLPQPYVWDETSAAKFTAAFRFNDILSLLHLFESTNFDLSRTDVENATNQFTNIMTEAAKRSLKLSSQKKSRRNPSTKGLFTWRWGTPGR